MKGDLKLLQGGWNIVTLEVEGDEYPPLGGRIEIKGDRFVSLNMGAEFEGAITVDSSASPKALDILYDKGPHAGRKSLAIYELKKDEWKLCLGLAGSSRPTKFATKKGTGHALETLRRGDAAPQPSRTESAAPPTELEGEWSMTSCLQNGKPMPKASVACARRAFRGDRATLYIGPQVSSQSRFTLNGRNIDYTDLKQAGIFELSKKGLKITVAEPGAERPDDFSSEPGSRRTLTEWRRAARA
jgi:uncharacterized protein (TIGR03067 family)